MTWTLSSDWCISRRIASQIKRSSTLFLVLLDSALTPTVPHRFHIHPPSVCLTVYVCTYNTYTSVPSTLVHIFRRRRQVYRQKPSRATPCVSHLFPYHNPVPSLPSILIHPPDHRTNCNGEKNYFYNSIRGNQELRRWDTAISRAIYPVSTHTYNFFDNSEPV